MEQQSALTKSLAETLAECSAQQVSGELLIQCGEESGKLYLESGQVIWAFTPTQPESFQHILVREHGFQKEQLLEGIKRCRLSGKKGLDEILAELGISNTEVRQSIFSRHIQSALEAMQDWTAPAITFAAKGSSTKDVAQVLKALGHEIKGFVATMIIENRTGMPVASFSNDADFDVEGVSAFYRDVVKSSTDAIGTLKKTSQLHDSLDEIIIASEKQFVLLRALKKGEQVLYVALTHDANPALARISVKRHLPTIEKLLA